MERITNQADNFLIEKLMAQFGFQNAYKETPEGEEQNERERGRTRKGKSH